MKCTAYSSAPLQYRVCSAKLDNYVLQAILMACSLVDGDTMQPITSKHAKQTLCAVTLHATTACTDKASIIGLCSLNWAIV